MESLREPADDLSGAAPRAPAVPGPAGPGAAGAGTAGPVTVDTRTAVVTGRRQPLGGFNPLDDPLANRVADLLNGLVPPVCAFCVVMASIWFVATARVTPDVWLLILGAVVGYLFGIQTRDKT